MKCFVLVVSLFFVSNLVYARDPIEAKRTQFAIMKQQFLLKQQQMAALKKQEPKKNVRLASLAQPKQVQKTQALPQQQKKIDLSSFAIKPMQAWKDELKVPSTSNDGIEIIPHPVNQ